MQPIIEDILKTICIYLMPDKIIQMRQVSSHFRALIDRNMELVNVKKLYITVPNLRIFGREYQYFANQWTSLNYTGPFWFKLGCCKMHMYVIDGIAKYAARYDKIEYTFFVYESGLLNMHDFIDEMYNLQGELNPRKIIINYKLSNVFDLNSSQKIPTSEEIYKSLEGFMRAEILVIV